MVTIRAELRRLLDWKGGGGFRFFRLAPSLLEKDKYGNWIISQQYNAAMLAEALCKNMGFVYAPSQDENEYWRHGHSTETDFIFVTTVSMTHAALKNFLKMLARIVACLFAARRLMRTRMRSTI